MKSSPETLESKTLEAGSASETSQIQGVGENPEAVGEGRSFSELSTQASIILTVVGGLGLLLSFMGSSFFETSLRVGLIATVVSAFSSAAAHLASEHPRGNEFALARVMIGMAIRTVLPLLAVLWGLKIAQPPLEKSLVIYIILLYFVGLLLDVAYNVRHLKSI